MSDLKPDSQIVTSFTLSYCEAVILSDCPTFRLADCLTVRLPVCQTGWLGVAHPTSIEFDIAYIDILVLLPMSLPVLFSRSWKECFYRISLYLVSTITIELFISAEAHTCFKSCVLWSHQSCACDHLIRNETPFSQAKKEKGRRRWIMKKIRLFKLIQDRIQCPNVQALLCYFVPSPELNKRPRFNIVKCSCCYLYFMLCYV